MIYYGARVCAVATDKQGEVKPTLSEIHSIITLKLIHSKPEETIPNPRNQLQPFTINHLTEISIVKLISCQSSEHMN